MSIRKQTLVYSKWFINVQKDVSLKKKKPKKNKEKQTNKQTNNLNVIISLFHFTETLENVYASIFFKF